MDLKGALWKRVKYLEYFDEISACKSVKNDRAKEQIDMKNKMQELSDICYDIAVNAGSYGEETTVTICMPYNNLRYLFVMNKEENKMPVYVPDSVRIAIGCTTKTNDNKPKWIDGMLPGVEKVETYNNRVVKVTFIDGTYTKAVCSENDNFDLDMGITICAMKRLLGTNSENATKHYNQFINHVHSVMEKNTLKELAEEAQKAKEKSKKRKAELKRAAKKLKVREEQIDIQKQAILRAQKETFSQFEGGAPI